MKYYAVTDDPNELLHYGVKGMKWGQHLFGDDLRPKSAGYKRALGKLKGFAKKAKSSVQKSATQHAMNKQKKQEDKFNKAVQKSQQRINAIENMRNLHSLTNYEKQSEKAYNRSLKESRMIAKSNKYAEKAQMRADKLALKNSRKFARNESKMNKYMQEAREGRLHYGKLSEDQVRKITDRLALERSARSLGNTEKPKFRRRMKDALQEGILQGVVQGTAAGMKEIAVAKIQNRLSNKRTLDKQNRNEAKRQKEASRIKNKKTHEEIKQDIRDELYEEGIKEGRGMFGRRAIRVAGAAKKLNAIEEKRLEDTRKRKLEARINDEIDAGNNERYQNFLSEQREKKRIQDVQDRLASEKDEAWQRYLDDNNLSDEEARARKFLPKATPIKVNVGGKPVTIMTGGQADTKERKKLNEGKVKSAGSIEEQRQRILNDEKEAQKKKEQDALEQYEKVQNYSEQKERIEKHNERAMNVYQQQLAEFNKGNRKTRPTRPTINNGKLLKDPDKPRINADQYKVMQDLRLSPYNGNNGGKGGGKGKGKGGGK